MSAPEDRFDGKSPALQVVLRELLEGPGTAAGCGALADHLRECQSCRQLLDQSLVSAGVNSSDPADAPGIVWQEDSPGPSLDKGAATRPANDGAWNATSGAIVQKVDELCRDFGRLAATFEDKIRFDASREMVIDRLHAELQEYKADLFLKILRPLALELIGLQDDVGKMIAAREADDPVSAVLVGVRDDIDDLLYRSGFESFSTDRPEFDPKCQRVVRTVPTTDPSLVRAVAERLRKGFMYQGHLIRPEMVNVYITSTPAAG